jgi:nitroimidazol reductase NimA-like FMN-containing flavoprotein (pyridoxamine 5'-phosphate oxidase superfamily)
MKGKTMFRELVRIKQALPQEECIAILQQELRGVLSVQGDDGYPYGMPLNHFYLEEDGCIYFHSGKIGHKVDAIKRCDKASYCVYDEGYRKEGDWALTIRSVIVFGRIEIVEAYDTVIDISRKLSYKFTQDAKYIEKELTQSGPRTLMFRLRPEHICGKRVHEA